MIVIAVFMLAPGAWAQVKYKTLHKFAGIHRHYSDGASPAGGLIFDQAGNLYGTTVLGGNGSGTVFEMTPNSDGSWTESVLYRFCSLETCEDGAFSYAGLIFDQAGNLYGTALEGGSSTFCSPFLCGNVFKLTPNADGSWTQSVLYGFCSRTNCEDGGWPFAGLIFDQAGNLYGTTHQYGAHGAGVVFELTPNADGSWKEKVLHQFTGGRDGGNPYAGLIFDQAGNLYGTTGGGGAHGAGVVFKLTPNADGHWKENVLHTFTGSDDGREYNGGSLGTGSLIFDQAGNLYGTTAYGGASGSGVVFELVANPEGGWKEKVLHHFTGGKNGSTPMAPLIFDQAGNLYGTTTYGGWVGCGCGVAFKLTPNSNGRWNETVLHRFATNGNDGGYPVAGLIFDAAGNLYGTTCGSGEDGPCYGGTMGSVFEITP